MLNKSVSSEDGIFLEEIHENYYHTTDMTRGEKIILDFVLVYIAQYNNLFISLYIYVCVCVYGSKHKFENCKLEKTDLFPRSQGGD